VDALTPGNSPREAWEEIRLHPGSAILVSGHEPLLSGLAAFLLGTPSLLIDLKKGSLLRIDMDHLGTKPRGVLRWYYTAKIAMAAG
jgi:phosphohistidine phosphatase SixA